MGATLDVTFIDTEDFLTKIRAVAEYPIGGPEQELFWKEVMFNDDRKSTQMGTRGFILGYRDIHDFIAQKLPLDLSERLDFFVSTLIYGNYGHSFANTYYTELGKINCHYGWLVDVPTVHALKGASSFIDYLKANKAMLTNGFSPQYEYQDLATYLNFLERWSEIIDTALERNCGLFVTFA